jgi:hypothetical protein
MVMQTGSNGNSAESLATNKDVVYVIDDQDRLVCVNENWEQFASQNLGEELLPSSILNQSIWQSVVDRDTRLIYEELFSRVREHGEKLRFAYRCDTPTLRRFMELQLHPLAENQIQIVSRVLRVEERAYTALLDPLSERSQAFIDICGWCKRVHVSEDRWVEVEEAIQVLGLFDAPTMPHLSHGICPDCLVDFRSWRKIEKG